MKDAKMKAEDLPRLPRKQVELTVEPVIKSLDYSGVKYEICGSWRRKKETCKDLDILVQAESLAELNIMNLMKDFQGLGEVRWSGDLKMSFFYCEIPIDIKVVPKESWGAGLLHHTGNAQFNMVCRRKAKSQGYLLNEYGLWTREDDPEQRERICPAESEAMILLMLWPDNAAKAAKYANHPEEREL